MTDAIIRVENLGKRYELGGSSGAASGGGGSRYRTLRETMAEGARGLLRWNRGTNGASRLSDPTEFWALKDVSFEVKQGEVLGIIGRNGAGKSTLLKILSRITEPTEGRISLRGRVASLLEVGTGFHPELTGRENIFLNGAVLGMHRREIRAKFDEIVAFAEVERFLDTPVKRYSSGMYVRLAFAVAAHLEPEILIVDEVLAVGDAEFQRKCLGKMESVAKGEGRTVLFVSHNMGAVSKLCRTGLFIAQGQIMTSGAVDGVISDYYLGLQAADTQSLDSLRPNGFGKEIWFSDIRLRSSEGNNLGYGQALIYDLEVCASVDGRELSIGSSIFDRSGSCVGSLLTKDTFSISGGERKKLQLTIGGLCLAPGYYYGGCSLGRGGHSGRRLDMDIVIGQPTFQVTALSEDGFLSNWASSWGNIVLEQNQLSVVETA